ncbi:hypothetical protein AAFC00_001484 [Neodothiora populina]|uniref:FAS1 domain-containing protein n=1 Tax=Neodothiora populina TaxID=2781224 RepID=A0ABR3PPB1_9PEZI
MRFATLVPFIGLSTAFVVPDEQVFSELAIQDRVPSRQTSWSDTIRDGIEDISSSLDRALAEVSKSSGDLVSEIHETAFDAQSWVESGFQDEDREHPPHHGPPDHKRPPHHGPPDHDRPHHPPHHHEPNFTVYELIVKSKYTTKLAGLINEYPDLVEALNGTKANYTIFAPTDKAFERIPEHAPKPSKEDLKKILSYHISPEFYPAGRVLASHTIPTLLKGENLPKDAVQRLSLHIGLKGLTVNFYSRVVAINIFGTNGVIHGVDHIILPPPKITKILELLPSEFSTLELGLAKVGMNSTDHPPGTLFAPSNSAFSRLGPRINAFLFSPRGLPYLEALLKYHIAPKNVLYSDAFYSGSEQATDSKGVFHVDLPTLLEDRSLSIDIAKYYGFIEMKINSFARVSVFDGVADDGVIQVVSSVLVPPKKLGGMGTRLPKLNFWDGEEDMSVEEFVDRLQPFVIEKIDL